MIWNDIGFPIIGCEIG